MDPLSALSLATSVVQFVQFATSLLNGTRKIYNSSSDTSKERDRIEFVHEKLSSHLQTDAPSLPDLVDQNDPLTLADLASRCREDCKRLVDVVERIRMNTRLAPKIWGRFCVAVAEILRVGELERLHKRVEGYQSLMIFHVFSALSEVIENLDVQVQATRSESRILHGRISEQLTQISQDIRGMYKEIGRVRSGRSKASVSPGDVESLTTNVSRLSLDGVELARHHKLLQSLDYRQRPARHENISAAHELTFCWLFSNTNTPEKAKVGLLRSLLYDILAQSTEFCRLACSDQWSQLEEISKTWSLSELQSALDTVASQTNLGFGFCFFIDGVDEYAGNHASYANR
ncbi:hypothetical protein B0H63DRAFT_545803 [Podospora didyma]|uniref:Fungal N-terminal domain-containing protein n=1 Tax=Podospora didyma TaxID=330526 RepID=A0AAE0TVU9_9PEZI|nr:hypothetical protein B0H63DRAFT_545803 [Podospora didyma]